MVSLLLSPAAKTTYLFLVFVPYLLGFFLLLTSFLGPWHIQSTSMSLMRIGPKSGVSDPGGPSGAYFGTFGSCYRIHTKKLTCAKSQVTPDYNSTLEALTAEGLPDILASVLVDHLEVTPTVQIVGMTFMFVALPLVASMLLSGFTSFRVVRGKRLLSLTISKYIFLSAVVLYFWGYILALTASLAQQDQFSQAAKMFNTIEPIETISNVGLQHASLGGAFGQQWAAYTFLGLCVPVLAIYYLVWPETPIEGSWSFADGGTPK